MHQNDEEEGFLITDRGIMMAKAIETLFGQGWELDDICLAFDLTVLQVQIIMLLLSASEDGSL